MVSADSGFGELSTAGQAAKRTATVVSGEHSIVMHVPKVGPVHSFVRRLSSCTLDRVLQDDFVAYLTGTHVDGAEVKDKLDFLNSLPLFSEHSQAELRNVSYCIREKSIKAGDQIVRTGKNQVVYPIYRCSVLPRGPRLSLLSLQATQKTMSISSVAASLKLTFGLKRQQTLFPSPCWASARCLATD
jgi:hypothetical protein